MRYQLSSQTVQSRNRRGDSCAGCSTPPRADKRTDTLIKQIYYRLIDPIHRHYGYFDQAANEGFEWSTLLIEVIGSLQDAEDSC